LGNGTTGGLSGIEVTRGVSCVFCTRGKFSVAGQGYCETCGHNSVSTAVGAGVCNPCYPGMRADDLHQKCIPVGTAIVNSHLTRTYDYTLSVFCVGGPVLGLRSEVVNIPHSKPAQVAWDNYVDDIIAEPALENFVHAHVMFSSPACGDSESFLHAMPLRCAPNFFAMHQSEYIWECAPCPVGTHKTTDRTIFSDCVKCVASDPFVVEQALFSLTTENFQTLTISITRGSPVSLKWPSSDHPVGISTDPNNKVLPAFTVGTLDDTTVFNVPLNFRDRLFYYCTQHSSMGIHEITVV